jgi:hypothetical protein
MTAAVLLAACTSNHTDSTLAAATATPSQSLSASVPAVLPSPSVAATPSPTPTPTPKPTPTHTRPAMSVGTTCPAYKSTIDSGIDGYNVVTLNGDPTVFTLNPKLVAACPTLQLKVVFATYSGAGLAPTTLNLYTYSTAIVSAAHPHTTLRAVKAPLPGCRKSVWLIMAIPANKSVPRQVPRSPEHVFDSYKAIGGIVIGPVHWGDFPDC